MLKIQVRTKVKRSVSQIIILHRRRVNFSACIICTKPAKAGDVLPKWRLKLRETVELTLLQIQNIMQRILGWQSCTYGGLVGWNHYNQDTNPRGRRSYKITTNI